MNASSWQLLFSFINNIRYHRVKHVAFLDIIMEWVTPTMWNKWRHTIPWTAFCYSVINPMLDALRDLHTSKYKRPRNKPDDGCLWKPARRSNVRTRKQLWIVASTETFNGNQALCDPSNALIDTEMQTLYKRQRSAVRSTEWSHGSSKYLQTTFLARWQASSGLFSIS